jgi:hypothetical protein
MRRVDRKIREHHDNIIGAAFSLSHWISVAKRNPNVTMESRFRLKSRILSELQSLTDKDFLNTYAERVLDRWVEDNKFDVNVGFFFDLLNLYTTTLERQHAQNTRLVNLFESQIAIEDQHFIEAAKAVIARRLGKVMITQGSGAFRDITHTSKVIRTVPKERLIGGIKLRITNYMPPHFIVPLTEVRTWLPREVEGQGWLQIDDMRNVGEFDYPEKGEIKVDIEAPETDGTYFLIFAFREETESEYVASSTYWKVGTPVWNDGCDLADLSEAQISQIQKEGHAEVGWLYEYGYAASDLPADAIALKVTSSPSK